MLKRDPTGRPAETALPSPETPRDSRMSNPDPDDASDTYMFALQEGHMDDDNEMDEAGEACR
jgi:hypothetical protein